MRPDTQKTVLAWILALLSVGLPLLIADLTGIVWFLLIPLPIFVWAIASYVQDHYHPGHLQPLDPDRKRFKI